jgi:phosphate starvation-inducible protein PhoH and related proteins
LGFNSKTVVTGDITQIDLPSDRKSGLIEVREILSEVNGIQFVYFDERDVVRHRLVQEIIKAYDRHGAIHPANIPPQGPHCVPNKQRSGSRQKTHEGRRGQLH